ncbi:MAG: hypothetical protein IJQ25_08665, partial [Oscillibacter sp.]|nr:hypothetical protein [Oscillibacter sp.]
MRHLTKRLLAGVLALALLCGANTAFAVEAKIYTGSHATGSTTNEGTVTEGLVNVVLPSVQEDFFDFVLDPGNCIASTNAAAYNGIAYREGSVYFRSLADNGEVLLSPDSHPLTIINKGVVPVEADVSLKVNKGQYDFTFADTPDFLDANGNAISGNAMYLALASGRRTAPVKSSTDETGNTVYSASLRNWIGVTENTHDVVWNPDTEAYGYVIKDGLTDDDFQSASFYVTGEISDGDWEEAESGINLSVVWDIYYSQSDDSESPYSDPDIEPSVRVKTGTREAGGTVVLRVDMGAGANLMTYIDRVSYLHSNGTVGTIDQLSLEAVNFYTNTVTFSAPSDILNGSDWKLCFSNGNGGSAEVPFDPVAEEVFEPDPAVTVLSKASEAGDMVIMDVYFGHGETAYPYVERLEYTKADGTPTAFLGLSRSNASDTGVTVSLTANSTLLAGRDWKLILSNDAGQTTALDAAIYDATAVPQEPSVTVNSKASVVGDRVSLTVSYGSGATAYPYVDQIVYDSGTIAKSALTIEGQTITFAATEAILAGRNWKLQLSNKASETFLMDIDIYEEPAVDPTVTVTSKASASGDTATMTVDWGAGAKAMTSVSKITYKKSGGTAATIKASSSSLTVNGNTVSLTFDATTIKGTDFVLVLTNASSETKEFPVDLVEPAQETGTDPTVTVASKASASGDTATMTVNWGTGSK